MNDLKLRKELENAQDELESSSIYDESVKQQENSVRESMKSLKLHLTEGEAEIRNIEELKNKKKKEEEDFKSRGNLGEERRKAERRSASPVFVNANTLTPGGCPPSLERRNVHWDGVRVVEDKKEKDLDKSDLKDSNNEKIKMSVTNS